MNKHTPDLNHAVRILILSFMLALFTPAFAYTMSGKPSIDQEYLFEYSFINFAWGFRMSGVYIDKEGGVYRYDHSHAMWEPSSRDTYSESDLEDKYTQKERIGSIDKSQLYKMYGLINRAAEGKLSRPVSRCMDFGTGSYIAYIFNRSNMSYRPILLYQFGDVGRKNMSGDAKMLYEWLFTVTKVVPHNCIP